MVAPVVMSATPNAIRHVSFSAETSAARTQVTVAFYLTYAQPRPYRSLFFLPALHENHWFLIQWTRANSVNPYFSLR